jgi:hypothetical protein
LLSFDRSEVATPYGAFSFAFKISVSCKVFRFLRLGVVSSCGSSKVFLAENFEDGNCPSPGILLQPRTYNYSYFTELLLISFVKTTEKLID